MSTEQLDLASYHDGMAGTALQTNSLHDVQIDGPNDGHSPSDTDRITQASQRLRQTGCACRCSQDPVLQIYTHFKSMQKLHQQRQTRVARDERKRHKKSDISSKTFSVDSQSGRWLGLYLNSTQPTSTRALNFRNIEFDSNNQNNANNQQEQTLGAVSWKSQTDFLRSPSQHFENHCEDTINAKSSFQTEDSNRQVNKSKNQLNFNTPESAPSQRNSAKMKIHWNNVPPGRVTPAHVPVITIDRNRLM